MGVIIRQSVRSTIISYLGLALGFVITIWLYPRILTAEQYGLTRVLLSLAAVSSQFANLGINNTIIRYFPYFNDKESNHHGFLFLIFLVPFIGFLLLGAVLFFGQDFIISYFQEESALLTHYYLLIIPLVFFTLFFAVLTNFIRVLYDIVVSSFLQEVFVRVLVILALGAYLLGWIDFYTFMVIFALNYGIILALLFVFLFKNHRLSFRPDFSFLKPVLVNSMLNYSAFAFMGGLASIAVANIDIIMLGAMAGLEATGIYAIAFYVASAITITRKSIYNISSPIIADAFKSKNFALITDIYQRSALNQLIGGGLLFCGVLANLHNLMALLPPAYAAGSVVIILIGGAKLFDMSTGLNGAIILNSTHYRFDLYATIFLICIAILLNYLLIPLYGIVGAAIGSASAILLYNVMKVIYVAWAFKIQPFRLSMLAIAFIGAVVLLLVAQMGVVVNTYIDILVRSCIVSLLYIAPIFWLGISSNFNDLVRASLAKINHYLTSEKT